MNVKHRPLNVVPDSIAPGGGVAIRAQIARGGVNSYWDEVRWDGKPGERSIWIVKPNGRESPQAVNHVILKGTTPLTLYQPYSVACGKNRVPVMQLGISLIAFQESRGDVWDKYVAKNVNMAHGIGAVVGVNNDAVLPSLVYIIIEQGPAPTTFEVVITWATEMAGPAAFFRISAPSTCASRARLALVFARGLLVPPAPGAVERVPTGSLWRAVRGSARIENVLAKATVLAGARSSRTPCCRVFDYCSTPEFATQVTRA